MLDIALATAVSVAACFRLCPTSYTRSSIAPGSFAGIKHPDRSEASHVRYEDISDHQVERAIVHRRETVRAAVRERNPETALLEPDADGKGVPFVIEHKDATHRYLPCGVGAGIGAPIKKGRPVTPSPAVFALRISALSHFRRKLPRCLPCTVYKFGSIASRDHTRDFEPNRIPRTAPLSRRDVQTSVFAASDIAPFISLAVIVFRHCNSRVEDQIDGAGAAGHASCSRHLETASVTMAPDDGAAHGRVRRHERRAIE
jgi:hypothetical protein